MAEASRVSRRQEAPDWTFDGTLFDDMRLETFAEQVSAALGVIAWGFRETNHIWEPTTFRNRGFSKRDKETKPWTKQ
jgi:hypothetical protein